MLLPVLLLKNYVKIFCILIICGFCLLDNPCNIYGQKMKQQCEDRLKYFETGEKPPKNVDVMHDAFQESIVLQQEVSHLCSNINE